MAKRSKLAMSPNKDQIIAALAARVPGRLIAARHGMSIQALSRERIKLRTEQRQLWNSLTRAAANEATKQAIWSSYGERV